MQIEIIENEIFSQEAFETEVLRIYFRIVQISQ